MLWAAKVFGGPIAVKYATQAANGSVCWRTLISEIGWLAMLLLGHASVVGQISNASEQVGGHYSPSLDNMRSTVKWR
jgi:hypothetical protein